jgi:hypothetical protein
MSSGGNLNMETRRVPPTAMYSRHSFANQLNASVVINFYVLWCLLFPFLFSVQMQSKKRPHAAIAETTVSKRPYRRRAALSSSTSLVQTGMTGEDPDDSGDAHHATVPPGVASAAAAVAAGAGVAEPELLFVTLSSTY